MTMEPRSQPAWAGKHSPDMNVHGARDARLRSGLLMQLQLGGRLRATYGGGETPLPDLMTSLAKQIETCLQNRK